MVVVGPAIGIQHRPDQAVQPGFGCQSGVIGGLHGCIEIAQMGMDDAENQRALGRVVMVEQGLRDMAMRGDL